MHYRTAYSPPSLADNGKSVTIAITDRCVGCAEWDLDFSPAAFSQLADESVGRIHGMTWTFD